MNILTYGFNFYPELTGIGKYSGEMCFELAKKHDVTMIAAFPFYPQWKVHDGYNNKWWKRETVKGVKIIRCPLPIPSEVTSKNRMVQEFTFLFTTTLTLMRLLFKPVDVIVVIVTPFHLGIPARIFAWLKGIPMVYHIQDLQVDAARGLNLIKSEKVLGLLERVEKWILDKSDMITTISSGMINKVKEKDIPDEKIVFFPNWVDAEVIYPMSKDESLRSELGFLRNDEIVLYSGNLGDKQGLEQIIEVADKLRERPNLKFVIVGEGKIKESLVADAKSRNLTNVFFFPLQPYEKLSALLAMADLHLVLQKSSAADLVMPSKLTSILAVGGCAIVTAEEGTSLYEVVHDNNLGIVIEPEDVNLLQQAIENGLGADLSTYQQNARQYAEKYLDKVAIIKAFEEDLKGLIAKN